MAQMKTLLPSILFLLTFFVFARESDALSCVAGENSCPPSFYCAASNGGCSGEGICTPIPRICTKEMHVVCGCNGKTFANNCLAAAAGTGIQHDGSCDTAAKVGGCATNEECGKGKFCAFAEGSCGDTPGTCAPRPEMCTMEYSPMCGCDGQTYGSVCTAAGSGTSIRYRGECRGL